MRSPGKPTASFFVIALALFFPREASPFGVASTTPGRYELDVPVALTSIEMIFDAPVGALPAGAVRVAGVMSGLHPGNVSVSGDTVTFTNTSRAFLPGEPVMVNLRRDVQSATGDSLSGGYYFGFTIGAAQASADWASRLGYAAQDIPYFIHGGDFDNDGTPDIAVPNEGTSDVSIFLNESGNGIFVGHVDYAVGQTPSSIFGEDFDNDGWQDLATADINSGTMTVLLNNGDGTFTSAGTYPAGVQTRQVDGGDFDGDNDVDLCVTSASTDRVFLFYNDGAGNFAAGVPYTDLLPWPFAIRTGDVNGDGHLDIGVACQVGDSLVVMMNNGSGSFSTTGHYRIGNGPWDLVGNDLDGDGDFDFVSVTSFSDRVHVLINDGTGAFPTRNTNLAGNFPLAAHVADLDSDGDIDVTTTGFISGTVDVFLNNGTGVPVLDTTMGVPLSGSYAWASDLDGDGDLDLSVVDELIDSLFVFYNGATPTGVGGPGETDAGPLAFAGVRAWPNPMTMRTGTGIFLGKALGVPTGEASVRIYAASGRSVRDLWRGPAARLALGLRWDGRDDRGEKVASGRYLIVVESEGERQAASVQVVR